MTSKLSKEAKAIQKKISSEWELDTSAQLLLISALECYDEFKKAKQDVDRYGYMIKSKTGIPHANPALMAMKISRGQFIQLWKALHLDFEEAPLPGRPPGDRREYGVD